MQKFMITGGTGFVGSHLIEELMKLDSEITVIDDFSNSSKDRISQYEDRVNCIEKDISDSDWSELSNIKPDVIFHLATHPRSFSIKDPRRNMEVNVNGTLNLLEFAKKNNSKVIYTSNSGIYGNPLTVPIDESFRDNPTTPYDVNKLVGEYYGKIYHKFHGVYFITFRLATVYGERQKINEKLGWYPVIPTFVEKLLQNDIPTIHSDGNQTRDFIYVKDVVDCLILGSKSENSGGELFNLSTETETSINDVYSLISKILKKDLQPKKEDELPGDIRRMCYSYKKAKDALGYSPKFSVEKGIKIYIEWCKNQIKK